MTGTSSYANVLKGTINTRNKPIMSLKESYQYTSWETFRNIGLEIFEHAKKIGLNLELDNLTRGNGSCFMIAVLQQCNRRDVKMYLQDDVLKMATDLNFMAFRKAVISFMIHSSHPSVLAYKRRYETNAMPVTKKNWVEYWN